MPPAFSLFKLVLLSQLTLSVAPQIPSYSVSRKAGVFYSLDGSLWQMQLDGSKKRELGKGSWPALSEKGDQLAFIRRGDLYTMKLASESGMAPAFIAPGASTPSYYGSLLYYLARSGFLYHLWSLEPEGVGVGSPEESLDTPTTTLYYTHLPSGELYATRAPYDLVSSSVISEKAATYRGEEIFLPPGDGGALAASSNGKVIAYVSGAFSKPCLYFHSRAEGSDGLLTCSSPWESSFDPAYLLYAMQPAFLPDGRLAWVAYRQGRYQLLLYSAKLELLGILDESPDPIFFVRGDPRGEGFFFLKETMLSGSLRVALFFAGFPRVTVNDQPVDFGDSPPVFVRGELFVPIQKVGKALGFTWEWDRKLKKTVGLHPEAFVELYPREGRAVINGEVKKVNLPILQGRQYMSLHLLATAIGGTMELKKEQFLAEVLWQKQE